MSAKDGPPSGWKPNMPKVRMPLSGLSCTSSGCVLSVPRSLAALRPQGTCACMGARGRVHIGMHTRTSLVTMNEFFFNCACHLRLVAELDGGDEVGTRRLPGPPVVQLRPHGRPGRGRDGVGGGWGGRGCGCTRVRGVGGRAGRTHPAWAGERSRRGAGVGVGVVPALLLATDLCSQGEDAARQRLHKQCVAIAHS